MIGRKPGDDDTRRADRLRLGTLETQVMDVLWTGGAFAVRDLIDRLPNSPAYTTIATVLTNLRKKGLVKQRKKGRASLYEARLSREEYAAQVMEQALDTSGDRAASMLHFVNRMPEDDLDLLRDFLRGHHPEGES